MIQNEDIFYKKIYMYFSLIPEISDIALQLRCEACTKLQVETCLYKKALMVGLDEDRICI